MLLTIDAGNSSIKFGLYQGTRLVTRWPSLEAPVRTVDQVAAEIGLCLEQLPPGQREIDAVVIACVVPPVVEPLRQFCREGIGAEPQFAGETLIPNLPNRYDPPSAVGIDRLVNALAALHRYGAPGIILDLGTATTVDVLSPAGEFLGGAIAPGIGISLEALYRAAPHLPRVEVRRPAQVIGRNTVENLQSGVYHGALSQVEGLVTWFQDALGEPAVVTATGGWSWLLEEAEGLVDHLDPHLTLEGLRILWEESNSSR
jgi:type III pantothenate kinase